MRFPVFARRSNPAIDPPIVRKKMPYLESQVEARVADWVDPGDKRKGIIAREFLRLGERALPPTPEAIEKLSYSPVELPGLRYVPPTSDPRPSLAAIQANWSWRKEDYGALAG